MKAALLLVDLQNDFLTRPELTPDATDITAQAATLLAAIRDHSLPVVHIHTRIRVDGSDAMPHWQQRNYRACVAGSLGVLSPRELAPRADEPVFHKRYFSGFDNPQLDQYLRQHGIDTVILAGIYLHGCIRATALDAYAKGYSVLIADDATGSTEPLHGEITREYLDGRAANCLATHSVLTRLGIGATQAAPAPRPPVALVGGVWHMAGKDEACHVHYNPSNIDLPVSVFADAGAEKLRLAVAASIAARPEWSRTDPRQRTELLRRWRDTLASQADSFVAGMVEEVGKPLKEAREEFQRSLELIESCAATALFEDASNQAFAVRYRPLGTIGIITPWNNPVAIAAGKLAPALAYGNTAVWKPSPHATRIAGLMMASLATAGFPTGAVNLVLGGASTARDLMRDPDIDAVTLTGSIATGKSAAALCALQNKPLQAELGGNNAVIVLEDADLDALAAPLARAMFSYSGQRCTAIRRIIVTSRLRSELEARLIDSIRALTLGNPDDSATDIGPLISRQHLDKVKRSIARARAEGCRVLCGGIEPTGWLHGNWLEPALLTGAHPQSEIVQKETFGPVAIIQEVSNLQQAIELANAVPHGLIAGLISQNPNAHRHFLDVVEAGIIKLRPGPLPVHPEAPFGGWKASRIGLPEHGGWDREFYSRPQVIYG
jgi:acyl-CoA reductase-like NAD-dependent aldehyde dehydrogenase/nicotinamidase-related amidase